MVELKKTTQLRQLLSSGKIVVAPGAFNALSAKIIEQAGFPAVYMTGYGASADLLGAPDYGLLTLTEMANHAARLAQAVNVPVIADGDTGYGNALNVRRTIQEYERAGVAAIHLEDQIMPKRCGHMEGKQVIDAREWAKKIEAAVDTRTDPDFVIIARTDARAVYGLDEAISRAKMAVAAGADVIFVEAPQSVDELKKVRDTIDAPLMANMIEHGKTPLLSVDELQKLGYNLVIYPLATLYMAARAMREAMAELKNTGTTAGLVNRMLAFHEFNDLVGLKEFQTLERKYQVK
ncbi:MAG: isocitrate lyase/PEP mutase family protein [Candidatus Fermentithermobacillus carboniphilus]|uniref:2-methylisocitrate lyase n=1 Tax=Candidatus Fermentithermobacillus carboniphilus TaxID=3085328 RepID=A0AAT9LF00_9FIRM|nr:MAG: isocitrate lyase/PEP mutase family protein [Candidatus Fermentithermobacillus carboniphilus]